MQMTIDLTKAKPGWIAHFRCGGSAEITKMYGGQTLLFGDGGYTHTVAYTQDGAANIPYKSPFDIIKLEQPPFDWATVKPGDAFVCHDATLYFIADPNPGIAILSNRDPKKTFSNQHILQIDKFNLTRAAEHDIEVPS